MVKACLLTVCHFHPPLCLRLCVRKQRSGPHGILLSGIRCCRRNLSDIPRRIEGFFWPWTLPMLCTVASLWSSTNSSTSTTTRKRCRPFPSSFQTDSVGSDPEGKFYCDCQERSAPEWRYLLLTCGLTASCRWKISFLEMKSNFADIFFSSISGANYSITILIVVAVIIFLTKYEGSSHASWPRRFVDFWQMENAAELRNPSRRKRYLSWFDSTEPNRQTSINRTYLSLILLISFISLTWLIDRLTYTPLPCSPCLSLCKYVCMYLFIYLFIYLQDTSIPYGPDYTIPFIVVHRQRDRLYRESCNGTPCISSIQIHVLIVLISVCLWTSQSQLKKKRRPPPSPQKSFHNAFCLFVHARQYTVRQEINKEIKIKSKHVRNWTKKKRRKETPCQSYTTYVQYKTDTRAVPCHASHNFINREAEALLLSCSTGIAHHRKFTFLLVNSLSFDPRRTRRLLLRRTRTRCTVSDITAQRTPNVVRTIFAWHPPSETSR